MANIAFQSSRDGNYEIYVMDSDGSNSRRLTDHSESRLQMADTSPRTGRCGAQRLVSAPVVMDSNPYGFG